MYVCIYVLLEHPLQYCYLLENCIGLTTKSFAHMCLVANYLKCMSFLIDKHIW